MCKSSHLVLVTEQPHSHAATGDEIWLCIHSVDFLLDFKTCQYEETETNSRSDSFFLCHIQQGFSQQFCTTFPCRYLLL